MMLEHPSLTLNEGDRLKRIVLLSPKNIAVPHIIPTPSTASGRVNMLGPTVFDVTKSDADNTLVTASTSSPLPNDISETASNHDVRRSVPSPRVATDRKVFRDLPSLPVKGVCDNACSNRSVEEEEEEDEEDDDFIP